MTGAEHFRAAEKLLNGLDGFDHTSPDDQPVVDLMIAEAQVHATLALTAATAEAAGLAYKVTDGRQSDWHRALHGKGGGS